MNKFTDALNFYSILTVMRLSLLLLGKRKWNALLKSREGEFAFKIKYFNLASKPSVQCISFPHAVYLGYRQIHGRRYNWKNSVKNSTRVRVNFNPISGGSSQKFSLRYHCDYQSCQCTYRLHLNLQTNCRKFLALRAKVDLFDQKTNVHKNEFITHEFLRNLLART